MDPSKVTLSTLAKFIDWVKKHDTPENREMLKMVIKRVLKKLNK